MAQDRETYEAEIRDRVGQDATFAYSGGGKGQRVKVSIETGVVVEGVGSSKVGALDDAIRQIREMEAADPNPEPEPQDDSSVEPTAEPTSERQTLDDVLQAMSAVFGAFDVEEQDDDRTPGPVWRGSKLVTIVPCNAECMGSQKQYCDCRCGGANHGVGAMAFLAGISDGIPAGVFQLKLAEIRPVQYGPKPCLCGCGETTLRRFVPGHDARYHSRIKREQQAADRGVSVQDLPAILKAERKAAKAAAKANTEA